MPLIPSAPLHNLHRFDSGSAPGAQLSVKYFAIKETKDKWIREDSTGRKTIKQTLSWLTEVTLFGVFMEETHGNVPACCTSQTSVTRFLAFQCFPGHTGARAHYSHSVIRRGIFWREHEVRQDNISHRGIKRTSGNNVNIIAGLEERLDPTQTL